jgi:hypothetical protein
MQKFHHQAPICRATTSGIKSVANLKNFSLEKKKKKRNRERNVISTKDGIET